MLNDNKYNQLEEIAALHGLEIVETTSDPTGSPSHLSKAIIGFNTFSEARELADKYGMKVTILSRKDGQQLWYTTKYNEHTAPHLRPEDLGFNTAYTNIDSDSVLQDCKDAVEGLFESVETDKGLECLEYIRSLINSRLEILEELDYLDDDEAIFTDNDDERTEWKKVNLSPGNWSYDTHNYTVAIY